MHMKKSLLLFPMIGLPLMLSAQSAIDAYRISQPDLKGTARFMSMGGAFGALGGDLSTLSQNPGGIGIYRGNEIGFTLDLDAQSSSAESQGLKSTDSQTKFLLNNIGAVFTLRLPSSAVPNVNIGFTYNKSASFNRRYTGAIPSLSGSLSNYIAACATSDGIAEEDLLSERGYDPYVDSNVPWLDILGYNSFLFALDDPDHSDTSYMGQFRPGSTRGTGIFSLQESGGVDSYNIAFGGNINNVVYWGMDFDITHLNYTLTPTWSERLDNAYVEGADGIAPIPASWTLSNYYNARGNGFNFKLGVIVKPIQELRIGLAMHTPTWYSITETYSGTLSYDYNRGEAVKSVSTNNGNYGYNDVNFRTPWKFIASVAGVIGGRMIISADYEWTGYAGMKYSSPSSGGYYDYDYDYPYYDDWYRSASYVASPFANTNQDIKDYFRHTDTFRLGAEYRVTDNFSVRAGYCHVSSPVKDSARDGVVYTSGTIPSYQFDNTTNYVTCGLGYRINKFYVDLAYVYKHQSSEYYAYSPYPAAGVESQRAKIGMTNNQVVLSAGFKF